MTRLKPGGSDVALFTLADAATLRANAISDTLAASRLHRCPCCRRNALETWGGTDNCGEPAGDAWCSACGFSPAAVLTWAKLAAPGLVDRQEIVKETVPAAALKDYWQTTGEIPPGALLVPDRETFTHKVSE